MAEHQLERIRVARLSLHNFYEAMKPANEFEHLLYNKLCTPRLVQRSVPIILT